MEKENHKRRKSYYYVDEYGNRFSVTVGSPNGVYFTLYHSKLLERCERREFEYMSVLIDPKIAIYPCISELYERVGNDFIPSSDPIRDGRNTLILEQENENFVLTFCRDLSNELNIENSTNVCLNSRRITDIFEQITKEETLDQAKSYTMKLTS